ncbi:hypothetical protein [Pseudomonas sp. PS01296]|uniref:hypothetical protein n=1 Tax=Pseudomonas sp. PS01296 TaxID=2991432 RepID=UPI00249B854C|nr:hypothetical protein [Pseudomonas sp. PS01296]
MKLITLKPLLLGGKVVVEGKTFETYEQHGRELVTKGYAELDSSEAEPVVKLEAEPAGYALTLTSNELGPTKLNPTADPHVDLLAPQALDAPNAPEQLDPPVPAAAEALEVLDPVVTDAPQNPAGPKKKAS